MENRTATCGMHRGADTAETNQPMNTPTKKHAQILCLLLIVIPLLVGVSGCRGGSAAVRDGQKFPAVKPPADYVAERERLRRNAAAPGPPANRALPAKAQ